MAKANRKILSREDMQKSAEKLAQQNMQKQTTAKAPAGSSDSVKSAKNAKKEAAAQKKQQLAQQKTQAKTSAQNAITSTAIKNINATRNSKERYQKTVDFMANGILSGKKHSNQKIDTTTPRNKENDIGSDVNKRLNLMIGNSTAWAKGSKLDKKPDGSLHQINMAQMESINKEIREQYRKQHGDAEYDWNTFEPVSYDPKTGDYTLNYTGSVHYDPNSKTWSYAGGKKLSSISTTGSNSPEASKRSTSVGLTKNSAMRADMVSNTELQTNYNLTGNATAARDAQLEAAYQDKYGKSWSDTSALGKLKFKAGAAVGKGLYGASAGVMKGVDFLLPTETVFGKDNAFDKWIDDWYGSGSKNAQQWQNAYEYAVNKSGTASQLGLYTTSLLVEQIPLYLSAIATGGFSEAAGLADMASFGTTVASTAEGAGVVAADGGRTLLGAMQKIVQSPSFWMSYTTIAGDAYESAKESGASELQAMAYALSTAFLQSLVEQGGGFETMNEEAAAKSLREVFEKTIQTAWEEGGEEVVQDMIDQFMKLGYSKPENAFSTTDQDALINPYRSLQNFAGGAVAGGIMGGASHAMNYAANRSVQQEADTSRTTQTETTASAPQGGDITTTGIATQQEAPQKTESSKDETAAKVSKSTQAAAEETSKRVSKAASSDASGETRNQAQAQMGDAGAEVFMSQMNSASPAAQQAFANTYAAALEMGADSKAVDMVSANLSAEQRTAAVQAAAADRASMQGVSYQEVMQETLGEQGYSVYRSEMQSARNASDFSEAFLRYYNAGLEGGNIEDVDSSFKGVINSDVIGKAYSAGLADAKAQTDLYEAAITEGRVNVYKDGGLHPDSDIEGMEQNTIDELNEYGKRTGTPILVVPTIDNGTKNGLIANGVMVVAKDGDGSTINRAYRVTASHEVTHRIQQFAPKQYNTFRTAAIDARARMELAEYNNTASEKMKLSDMKEAIISQMIEDYGKAGVKLSRLEAMDEIAADYASELMINKDAIRQFIESRPQAAKTFWQKLKNTIRSLKRTLTGATAAERKFLRELGTAEKLWLEAFAAASDRAKTIAASDRILPSVEPGIVRNENGDILAFRTAKNGETVYNAKMWKRGSRTALDAYLTREVDRGNLDYDDAKSIMRSMDSIYDMVKQAYSSNEFPSFQQWCDTEIRFDKKGNPFFTVVQKNSEYRMNLDFSTVCKKRKTLDRILARLSKEKGFEKIVTDGVAVTKINDIIRQHGFEYACKLCYVDAKRYRIFDWAESFTHEWNRMVQSMMPAGETSGEPMYYTLGADYNADGGMFDLTTAEDADLTLVRSIANDPKQKASIRRMAKTLLDNPSARRQIYFGDLTYSEGLDALKQTGPEVYKLVYQHQGQAKPRTPQSETPYNNEITYRKGGMVSLIRQVGSIETGARVKTNKAGQLIPGGIDNRVFNREKAFAIGGVRMQSFSDYVPNMVFDYCQMFADLSAKRLPVQTYTKELTFARLFGMTGAKINLSLVPEVVQISATMRERWNSMTKAQKEKDPAFIRARETAGLRRIGTDANGNGIYEYAWAQESIDFDHAVALAADPNYSSNVGTIAVGYSDAHIRMLMEDDRINMIIPYHKSNLPMEVQTTTNLDVANDYSSAQRTYDNGTAVKNDFDFYGALAQTGDPRAAAQAYLDWCNQHGYTPKFSDFAYDANGNMDENYYKLLIDFRVYDQNGQYVPQQAVQMSFPEDFSQIMTSSLRTYQNTQTKFDNEVEDMMGEIKREIGKAQYSVKGAGKDVAARLKQMDEEYLAAVESGDTKKEKRMVADAASESDYNSHVYAGTNKFGFTAFDLSKTASGVVFATSSESVAHGYGKTGFAKTRSIDQVYTPDDGSIDTLIKNARNVLGVNYRQVSQEDIERFVSNVSNSAEQLNNKIEYLWDASSGEAWESLPEDVSSALDTAAWYPSAYSDEYWDIDKVRSARETLREHGAQMDAEIRQIVDIITSSAYGDLLFDAETVREIQNGTVMLQYDGGFVPAESVRNLVETYKNLGTYNLYGNIGNNPLVIDAKGAWWQNIYYNGRYYDTNSLAQFAKDNGYTALRIDNVTDPAQYSENANSSVYAFFDPTQLKSADTVTRNNNGDIILLSQRFNPNDSDIRYSVKGAGKDVAERLKQKQFNIIQQSNPMTDDYHTGIRSVDEILTFDEAVEELEVGEDVTPDFTWNSVQAARESGILTVYSSKPIESGAFVTPSKMIAQDYAGGETVNSKTVNISDVAWVDISEGQYAPADTKAEPKKRGTESYDGHSVDSGSGPANRRGGRGLPEERSSVKRPKQSAAERIRKQEAIRQGKITEWQKVSPAGMQKMSEKLLSEYRSNYDSAELTESLQAIYDALHSRPDRVDTPQARTLAEYVAADIVAESTILDTEMSKQYADLRSYVRNTAITVPAANRNDFTEGWAGFKKANPAVKFRNTGVSVDEMYSEISERYPELFPSDIINPADQAELIAATMQTLAPVERTLTSEEHDAAISDIADSIIDSFRRTAALEPTVADRWKVKMDDTTRAQAQEILALKDQQRRELDKLRKQMLSNSENYRQASLEIQSQKYNSKINALQNKVDALSRKMKDEIARTRLADDMYFGRKIAQEKRKRTEAVAKERERSNERIKDAKLHYANRDAQRAATQAANAAAKQGAMQAADLDMARVHENSERMDELVREYGAIEPGENPAAAVVFAKSKDGQTRTRRFMRTAAEANQTSDEQITDLERAVMEDAAASYVPEGNQANLNLASQIIETSGIDSATRQFTGVVDSGKMPSVRDIAIGSTLLDRALREGRIEDATRLTEQMAIIGTRAGQAAQAMRMLKQLGGVSQLRYANMAVMDIQKELTRKFGKDAPKVEIPNDLKQQLLQASTEQEKEDVMGQIFQSVADQMPVTMSEKVNAWRYFAMLANPRTHVRNLVGNAVFMPAITMKNVSGALIEAAISKTVAPNMERTKSIRALVPSEQRRMAARVANKTFDTVADEIGGGGKYNPANEIRDRKKLFKSKAGSMLEWAMDKNTNALEAEDVFFQKIQYRNALSSYIIANNLSESDLFNEEGKPTRRLTMAQQYAIREAQRATYHDASKLASALQQFSRSGTVSNLLTEGLMPFKKTPINILKRAVEYSPAGLIKTLTADTKKLRNGDITVAQYIDNISAGMVGSQVVALGAFLAAQGLLRASGGDDEDRANFEDYALGEQSYSVVVGDNSYTIDWAAPMVMPLMVGAELYRSMVSDGQSFADVMDSLSLISEPLISLSMMDGLQSALESVAAEDGNMLTNFAVSTVGSYVSQFVPTFAGQIARIGQENAKITYTNPDSWIPVFAQKILYKSRNKIPAIPQEAIDAMGDSRVGQALQWYNDHCTIAASPDLVDDWGRIQSNGSLPFRMFSNLVSPGFYSRIQKSSTDKELLRLYDAYGESAILPKYMSKRMSIDDGDKQTQVMLTAAEWTKYKIEYGTRAYSLLTDVMNTDVYRNASDDDRVQLLKDAYSYSLSTAGRAVRSDAHMVDWTEALQDSGIRPSEGITVRYVLQSMKDSFPDDAKTSDKQAAERDYIMSLPMTDTQKSTLDRLYVSKKSEVDYSNAESYEISQMSDSAQKKWEKAKAAGYTADQYQELYGIISAQETGYTKDKKQADAIAAGYSDSQFTQMWNILRKKK